jgi:hypothetical protein
MKKLYNKFKLWRFIRKLHPSKMKKDGNRYYWELGGNWKSSGTWKASEGGENGALGITQTNIK